MRRTVTIVTTTAAVLLGLGVAQPAHAADTTIVVNGPDDFAEELDSPHEVNINARDCSAPQLPGQPSAAVSYSITNTNDPDLPLGQAKFGLVSQTPDNAVAFGPVTYTPTPSTLSTWDIRVQAVDAGTTQGFAVALLYSEDGSTVWRGVSGDLDQTTGWHTADASALSLSWVLYSNADNQPVSPPTTDTGTVAAMAAEHGDGRGAYLVLAFGCGQQTYWDRYRVGGVGSVTTFDFERTLTKTSIAATPSTVVAGRTVAVTGGLTTASGLNFSSAQLTLEQKPSAAAEWAPVGTATSTTTDGVTTPARILVTPTAQTQYRWVYAGSPSSEPSTSPVATVKVAPALTIKAPTKVTKGKKATVTGKASPGTAGIALTLQAKVKGKWVSWASGATKAGGSYSLKTGKLTKTGTFPVRVVSKPTQGLVAGTSPQATVKVKKPKKK